MSIRNRMRTNADLAIAIATQRLAGSTVRAIAAHVGLSSSGVQGVLARLGLLGLGRGRALYGRLPPLPANARRAVRLLAHPRAHRLTARQRVILGLRARGLGTATIADHLGIGPSAVQGHLAAARYRIDRMQDRAPRCRRRAQDDELD